MRGVVVRFDVGRGLAIVKAEGEEIFCHWTNVMPALLPLIIGETVQFDIQPGHPRRVAVRVRPAAPEYVAIAGRI